MVLVLLQALRRMALKRGKQYPWAPAPGVQVAPAPPAAVWRPGRVQARASVARLLAKEAKRLAPSWAAASAMERAQPERKMLQPKRRRLVRPRHQERVRHAAASQARGQAAAWSGRDRQSRSPCRQAAARNRVRERSPATAKPAVPSGGGTRQGKADAHSRRFLLVVWQVGIRQEGDLREACRTNLGYDLHDRPIGKSAIRAHEDPQAIGITGRLRELA